MVRANDFSGIADGVAVTAGNSGGISGDAFTAVAGASWLAESSDGVPSVQALNPPDSSYLEWGSLGTLTVPVYLRYYIFLPGVPTVNHWVAGGYVNAAISNTFAPFAFATDGLLYDGAFTGGIGPFSTGQWIRVESRVLPGTAANGESEYRLYNNPDAGVNSWTARNPRTALSLSIADIDFLRFLGGVGSSNSTVNPRVRNVALSTVDWLGPLSTGALQVPPVPFW